MANPFSNTTRAIESDSFNTSIIVLCVAIILSIAWANWFFNGKISITATSMENTVAFSKDETIQSLFLSGSRPVKIKKRKLSASFVGQSSLKIEKKQNAFVYFKDKQNNKTKKFKAIVQRVKWFPKKKINMVELVVFYNDTLPELLKTDMSGFVEVELGYTTPANIAIKAVGMD